MKVRSLSKVDIKASYTGGNRCHRSRTAGCRKFQLLFLRNNQDMFADIKAFEVFHRLGYIMYDASSNRIYNIINQDISTDHQSGYMISSLSRWWTVIVDRTLAPLGGRARRCQRILQLNLLILSHEILLIFEQHILLILVQNIILLFVQNIFLVFVQNTFLIYVYENTCDICPCKIMPEFFSWICVLALCPAKKSNKFDIYLKTPFQVWRK